MIPSRQDKDIKQCSRQAEGKVYCVLSGTSTTSKLLAPSPSEKSVSLVFKQSICTLNLNISGLIY